MTVWLNRDTPLYTAVIRRPDGSERSFLVLTHRGPMLAKQMAEKQGGVCFRSQLFPYPLITPSIAEIEHLTEGSKIARPHALKLYRFTLNCEGQRRICLVWTSKGYKAAGAFAEKSLLGKVTSAAAVTNPILMDVSAESVLEAG